MKMTMDSSPVYRFCYIVLYIISYFDGTQFHLGSLPSHARYQITWYSTVPGIPFHVVAILCHTGTVSMLAHGSCKFVLGTVPFEAQDHSWCSVLLADFPVPYRVPPGELQSHAKYDLMAAHLHL